MKVCVVGLGYIGLPTSVAFGLAGCDVVGVDINRDIINTLNSGAVHIEEPGIEDLVKQIVANKKFHAAQTPEEADAFIVAVPTPFHGENYSCDLTYVLQACKDIIPFLKKGNVVIIESTIAPNSTGHHVKPIFEAAGFTIGKDLFLAHCPERVLPGNIMHEIINNNRIVGGITPACTEAAAAVYAKIVKGEIIKTEANAAELSKCMENTFRDVNIALANELANICFRLDINCLEVIALANKHPRVNLHQPGPGVGGHCLAIDPYFIYAQAPEEARIIKLARDTNTSMPHFVLEKTRLLCSGIANAKIAAFGVTYKGNIDDCRESPAMEIIEMLQDSGFCVSVFDPHVKNPDYVSQDEAVDGADLVLVLADHNEFKNMQHGQIAKKMRRPMLFDTKNIVKAQAGSGLEIVNFGNLYQYKKVTD